MKILRTHSIWTQWVLEITICWKLVWIFLFSTSTCELTITQYWPVSCKRESLCIKCHKFHEISEVMNQSVIILGVTLEQNSYPHPNPNINPNPITITLRLRCARSMPNMNTVGIVSPLLTLSPLWSLHYPPIYGRLSHNSPKMPVGEGRYMNSTFDWVLSSKEGLETINTYFNHQCRRVGKNPMVITPSPSKWRKPHNSPLIPAGEGRHMNSTICWVLGKGDYSISISFWALDKIPWSLHYPFLVGKLSLNNPNNACRGKEG